MKDDGKWMYVRWLKSTYLRKCQKVFNYKPNEMGTWKKDSLTWNPNQVKDVLTKFEESN